MAISSQEADVWDTSETLIVSATRGVLFMPLVSDEYSFAGTSCIWLVVSHSPSFTARWYFEPIYGVTIPLHSIRYLQPLLKWHTKRAMQAVQQLNPFHHRNGKRSSCCLLHTVLTYGSTGERFINEAWVTEKFTFTPPKQDRPQGMCCYD